MTIDLSQFVDKKCIITLRNGRKCVVDFKLEDYVDNGTSNPCYYLRGEYLDNRFDFCGWYTKSGTNGILRTDKTPYDIVHIECFQIKSEPTNSPELPESTIEKLAEVLSPDAIKYITGTEEYVTFMTEMLAKFVRERMGNLNPEVECELVTSMVCSQIYLRTVK